MFQGQASWEEAQEPWAVQTVPSEFVCPLIFWKVLEWGPCTGLQFGADLRLQDPRSGGGKRGSLWLQGCYVCGGCGFIEPCLGQTPTSFGSILLKSPAKLSSLPPSWLRSLGGEKREEAGTRGGVARRGV